MDVRIRGIARLALLFVFVLGQAAQAQEERALDRAEGLLSDDVFDLCAAGPGRIWAATSAGLCRIERHEMVLAGPEGVPRLVAPMPGGGVHALYPRGVAEVRGSAVTWIGLPYDPARTTPVAMVSDPDGTLWLQVTSGSLYRRVPGGSWEGRPGRPLPRREVRHHGELWTATRGRGIVRRRLEPRFKRHAIPGASRVHSLAAAPDGTIWCGTENGLGKIAGGKVEAISAIGGARLGVVTALAVDREGRVWVGSGSSFTGVYRLDEGGWRHLDSIQAYVHRITTDPTGTLWFAVLNAEGEPWTEGEGAWYFSKGEFHPAPAIAGLPSGRVYDVVARDPSGVLWFATLKGLAAYEGNNRVTRYTPESSGLAGEKVWCLAASRDGSLWIGYQGAHGVSRLFRGQMLGYGVADGLCDENVWAIAEGTPGVLWFATKRGLGRYDGQRWSCFHDLGQIWPLLPLPDGSLWIGTLGEGVVHLVPGDDQAPRTRFGAPRYETRAGGAVRISWSGHDAWFDTPARDLWYRWRLDDGRWSPAAPTRRITLTPEPGRHRFQVQAIDRFGNAEDPPAEAEVAVAEAPRLPWVWAGAAALALLGLGFVIGRRDRAAGS